MVVVTQRKGKVISGGEVKWAGESWEAGPQYGSAANDRLL
jgi:hypothetical protein